MDTFHPASWPFRHPRRRVHLPAADACCGCHGCPRGPIRPTFAQACRLLWLVRVKGWTQANAAIEVGISATSASHIVRRRKFPNAWPVPFVPCRRGGCAAHRQGDFGF